MKKLILNCFKSNLLTAQAAKSLKGGYDGLSGWQYDSFYTMGGVYYYDCVNPSTGEHRCGLTHDQMDALCA